MNIGFLYFLGGLFFLVSIVLAVWFVIEFFRERKEPVDQTLLMNYMPQYANGHHMGVIDEVIQGDTRIGIKFFPRDYDYAKEIKKHGKLKIEPQTVFFLKHQTRPIQKETLSDYRNILKAYPPKCEDLPVGVKKTEEGKELMKIIEKNNSNKEETDILRMKNIRQKRFLEMSEGQEIAEDTISLEEESKSQIIKQLSKEQKAFAKTDGTT